MLYSQAEIIKHHRELRGLTQAQLAEGICSRFHIIKAEAGTRKLSDYVFKDVLKKLDLNPDDFNIGISARDNDAVFYTQMNEEIQKHQYSKTKEPFIKIKNDISNYVSERGTKLTDLRYWEYLALEADMFIHYPLLDDSRSPIVVLPDVLKAREYAIKAIKLFRPDFDIEEIDNYFLTRRELYLINILANIYGFTGETQTKVDIYKKLISNYEKTNKEHVDTSSALNTTYAAILVNLAIGYKELCMWEECLQHSTEIMGKLINATNILTYAAALECKACSLMNLERIDEGKKYHKQLFMLLYGLGDGYESVIADFKKEYEEMFGGTIDIREDW